MRECFGGTLGSLVQDSSGKDYFILSTNRVLARVNKAAPGEPIVQPGRQDTACRTGPRNVIGKLTEFGAIDFAHGAENLADVAIAAVNSKKVSLTMGIFNIGPVSETPISVDPNINPAIIGLNVQEMGAGTCQTLAVVNAVNVNVTTNYGHFPKPKLANFAKQIQITSMNPFTTDDIGSLVVTGPTDVSCPQPVGLLFAIGTVNGVGVGFATPAQAVLDRLNNLKKGTVSGLQFVGSCTAATVAPAAPTVKGFSAETIQAATDTRDHHVEELMSVPGAVGTGVGFGDTRDQLAIIVYVKRLTSEQHNTALSEIEGIPVVLRETGEIVAY